MIKSMTGFGRYEETDENKRILVEIKSVNHRYCEVSVRSPRRFSCFETSIRNLMKNYVGRGKIDINIYYEDYSKSGATVVCNSQLAGEYLACIKKLSEDHNLNYDIGALALSRYPEVLSLSEPVLDETEIWQELSKCISKAAEQLVASREKEGANLKKDVAAKLTYVLELVEKIKERSPVIIDEYREKIRNRVNQFLEATDVDERIIATEVTLFADKICVDEELVRLSSHIKTMLDTLDLEEGLGRKLDFISQEMNREANTILSKTSDITISNYGIELKTEIEKIREQIQNIE